MKRITLFFAAFLMVALFANALEVNNPIGTDGFYIVKWDCDNDTWAASNDFEVDETFTFAVDVTGTPLEDWLKETPTNAGATRSLSANRWTGFGSFLDSTTRMKQIKGNIYGVTWNLCQLPRGDFNVEDATATDAETFVSAQIFGFEYTAENPGAAWWQWPTGWTEGETVTPAGMDAMFKTLPYSGTKTSLEFYNDDYPGLFENDFGDLGGYAPACVVTTGIENVYHDAANVVGVEFYNLQGVKINAEPESGLYIKTSILSNGTRVSEKQAK